MKTTVSLLVLVCLSVLPPLVAEGVEITTKSGDKFSWPNWYETPTSICTATPDGKICIDKDDILKMKRPPRKERPASAKALEPAAKSEEAAESEGAKTELTDRELRHRLELMEKRLSDMEGRLEEIDQSLRAIESVLLGAPVE